MKILMIAADLSQGGGVNKVIVDLANLFVEEFGCSVSILNGASTKPPLYDLRDSVQVIHNRPTEFGVASYFAAIFRQRRERFDVVVSCWTHENIMSLVAFLGSRRTRVIICEHTSYFVASKAVAFARSVLYRAADCLVVLNGREFEHYRGIARRLRLIHNPISPPEPGAWWGRERERLILGVGHLIARKGFADLVEAFDGVGLATLGWRLALVGEGPLKLELEEQIACCGSRSAIAILQPKRDIGALYAKASLLVVPSRIEVFSLVLAEAMAWGVIPVAYSADGPAEILRAFPEHLAPLGDVEALSRRMSGFAREHHHDIELRTRLRSNSAERFAPRSISEEWAEVFGDASGSTSDRKWPGGAHHSPSSAKRSGPANSASAPATRHNRI